MPATSAVAAGQYGDVRPSAILRTIGGDATYQRQGQALAVSADGNTAVVAGGESMPRGGDWQGHVYVWVRTNGAWNQQTVLSPPPSDPPSRAFGGRVALSPDGRYLAVGDTSASPYSGGWYDEGAIYVYERDAAGWGSPTTISDPDTGLYDFVGSALAISGDGSLLVAGVPPIETPNPTRRIAWSFARTVDGWGPAQPLTVPSGLPTSVAGGAVAISQDGRHAAVANPYATFQGVGYAGDVITFDRSDAGTWAAGTVLGDQPPAANGKFGSSIAMSNDATTLVVGSDETGKDQRSRVAVFRRDSGTWVRSAQFYGYYSSHYTDFGRSVAVSASGDVVAVGVPFRDSATAVSSGAVHRYQRTGASWSYLGATYIKGAGAYEYDGLAVALAGDTDQLFIGAPGYARSNRPGARSGAVYVIG